MQCVQPQLVECSTQHDARVECIATQISGGNGSLEVEMQTEAGCPVKKGSTQTVSLESSVAEVQTLAGQCRGGAWLVDDNIKKFMREQFKATNAVAVLLRSSKRRVAKAVCP